MTEAKQTPTRELATVDAPEREELARVVESMVTKGDVSGLSSEERTRHYLRLCERLRLDPTTQPLMLLRLNGREIYYPTKGATDQLAAVWGVDRRLVERPHVVDTGAGKIIQAACEAHWRGRVDTSTGAVPMPGSGGEALCNALLKCETKAKRRATLSILGLGMLDETEVETIPASAKQSVPQPELASPLAATAVLARDHAEDGDQEPVEESLQRFREAVLSFDLPLTWAQAAAIWVENKASLTAELGLERMRSVWNELLDACPNDLFKGRSKSATLKRACEALEGKPPPEGPKGKPPRDHIDELGDQLIAERDAERVVEAKPASVSTDTLGARLAAKDNRHAALGSLAKHLPEYPVLSDEDVLRQCVPTLEALGMSAMQATNAVRAELKRVRGRKAA